MKGIKRAHKSNYTLQFSGHYAKIFAHAVPFVELNMRPDE